LPSENKMPLRPWGRKGTPSVVPPHFAAHHRAAHSPPRPASGPRCNGLTRAGLLSARADFFGSPSGRHSAAACWGGSQPVAVPSLAAHRSPTPPGCTYVVVRCECTSYWLLVIGNYTPWWAGVKWLEIVEIVIF